MLFRVVRLASQNVGGLGKNEVGQGLARSAKTFVPSVYQMPLSHHGKPLDIQTDEAAGGQLKVDGVKRNHAQPKPASTACLIASFLFHFHGRTKGQTMFGKERFGGTPGARPRFTSDEIPLPPAVCAVRCWICCSRRWKTNCSLAPA